ncbi:MAG: DUF3276 family protein [Bacteroidales bacterium]|nr:DUF3276 family protein [Bacteroidales bacterium]MDD3859835.1 DUF3276 family protein [Bacteroidales bacterium]
MEGDEKRREEIHSVSIRAGKRTYFFDVKETRQNDYYLTITESKKVFDKDGNSRFEKHKIFLYKEDFEKFMDGYNDAVNFIKENRPEYFEALSQEKSSDEESTVSQPESND